MQHIQDRTKIQICKNFHMHKMFIRTGIRKTRNTDDSLGSGTKLLLPF